MATLRVMTWNVQNLLAVGAEGAPRTTAELNAKIRTLAAVIDDARPHVLALQEVGDERVVARLQSALSWTMPHRALGIPDERGIRVGFISKRVVRSPRLITSYASGLLPVQIGDDPRGPAGPQTMNQLGRSALQIGVRSGGRTVRIVNCHLKSKLLSYPGGRFFPRTEDERARFGSYALFRRAAEATTVRVWLNDQLAGQGADEPVVLCGDMNDEVEAATTQILNGPTGSEIGTRGFASPDRGDGDRMWNLAPLIPEAQRYTRIYRGRGEMIDHVFVSRYLLDPDRLPPVRTLPPTADGLRSIDDDPRDEVGEPASDHAAILATLTV